MVSVCDLSVEFSSNPLFDHINFVVNPKEKIALVGKNGAGKTTLLKILAGLQPPTSGTVNISKELKIGYLPQHMKHDDSRTVREEVMQAFEDLNSLKEELESLNGQISLREDYESREYINLIERISLINDKIAIFENEKPEAEIEKTLLGLGFNKTDFDRMTSEFSGGWRMRIELAKILLKKPDLLLLDEPTNHLDIESIEWLENFLRTKANMVVLVSHDRAFMDNITQRTIEISLGKIYDYKVNYSRFIDLRKERIEQQTRAYLNQQKQIQDTEDFIERFRYKATKAVQVQSRIKQLEKIERIEIDREDNSAIKIKFPPAPRSGDYPLIIDNLKKSYGNHVVLEGIDFILKRGEKIAFVGKNGEGKSTLVKCINKEIDFEGELKTGHNISIGYFAQNQASLLDGELTVFDTIDRVAVGDIRTKINDLLGAFRFGGEESDKKVKVLSGGERTRLAMLRLLLQPVNFLILDEPTNHLDIRTKEVLKQAIKEFDGTVIVVSHDREFLDGLVDKVYEFKNRKIREHLGGINGYLEEKRRELNQSTTEPVQTKTVDALPKASDNPSKSEKKLTYAEQREKEKAKKRAQKKISDLEEEIRVLENKIKDIEERISQGETSGEIFIEHEEANKKLQNTMSYWELAVMEAEELD